MSYVVTAALRDYISHTVQNIGNPLSVRPEKLQPTPAVGP